MTMEQLVAECTAILEHLGLDIQTEATQDGDFFCLNLTGRDTRLLERGKDNRVGALITILKLITKQKYNEDPRLVIDINGQRQQRIQNVVQLAKKKAEMVRISGQEEEMPPMTPAERRAVHVELREMRGIKTESRGEEPHRRIVIVIDDEA